MATVKHGGAKKKNKKDPNAPKRPMSGYFLFAMEKRSKSEELMKMRLVEQGRTISNMWKELSDDEKEKYNQMSAKERESYHKALEEYKKSAEYRSYMDKLAAEEEVPEKKKKKINKVTAYNLFFKTVYKQVSDENPDFSIGEKTSAVAKRWKEISDDEKVLYNKMAEERNAGIVSVEE